MDRIDHIFESLSNSIPDAKIELNYTNQFTLLVAVVLSAQTTDAKVNTVTKELFHLADNPVSMFAIGVDTLENKIRTIGLYKTKANNIINLSKILIEKYNGVVPNSREALESLPGVGRKTASVVLNVAFGEPAIAVDTHVFRVSNRTGIASGKTVIEVEKKLDSVVSEKWKHQINNLLVLHGRYTCTARKPKCNTCCVSTYCDFYNSTS